MCPTRPQIEKKLLNLKEFLSVSLENNRQNPQEFVLFDSNCFFSVLMKF